MKRLSGYLLLMLIIAACSKLELIDPVGFEVDIMADSVIIAQIGDYGSAGVSEQQVSEMVKSWNPDFIITSGDNNYVDGEMSTIRENISTYYGDFIYNFDAPDGYQCHSRAYDDEINRFFPTPGNHDANNRNGLIPYYNFFTLPGNEIYYKYTWGPVSCYSLNSIEGNLNEQKTWLEQQLADSPTPFNIVYFHYPPYSSGSHGNHEDMQWDFYAMGVDVIFTGHDHIYERTEIAGEEGTYYVVNGIGGREKGGCNTNPYPPDDYISFCYDDDYGAVKITTTSKTLIMEFYAVNSPAQPVDKIIIEK